MLYLSVIVGQLLFVLSMLWRFDKQDARRTYQFVVCAALCCVYGIEFIRELLIAQGYHWLTGTVRLMILRVEHTVLGMFLAEIIFYAYHKQRRH